MDKLTTKLVVTISFPIGRSALFFDYSLSCILHAVLANVDEVDGVSAWNSGGASIFSLVIGLKT